MSHWEFLAEYTASTSLIYYPFFYLGRNCGQFVFWSILMSRLVGNIRLASRIAGKVPEANFFSS